MGQGSGVAAVFDAVEDVEQVAVRNGVEHLLAVFLRGKYAVVLHFGQISHCCQFTAVIIVAIAITIVIVSSVCVFIFIFIFILILILVLILILILILILTLMFIRIYSFCIFFNLI